jgi:hypothetical protein
LSGLFRFQISLLFPTDFSLSPPHPPFAFLAGTLPSLKTCFHLGFCAGEGLKEPIALQIAGADLQIASSLNY